MKKVVIFLDEKEEKNLNALLERYGGKAPALIKELLRLRYDKSFPAYKEKMKGVAGPTDPVVPGKVYTTAEACEFFGGKVDMKNLLGRVCLNPVDRNGVTKKLAPLTAMGIVSQYGDYTIDDAKVVETPIV